MIINSLVKGYPDFQSAFALNLQQVMEQGITISPRGMETKELLMHSFRVVHPERRAVISNARGGNPFAQVAETLWVLAGRNDLSWLEEYIPQCRKWSDDGETWRAGYGPRLRRWPQVYGDVRHDEYNYIDQIRQVYDKLRQDPDTRQAVITLWDPAEDWVEDSLDYPCNSWLHFIIRDNRLHLNVAIRSNDAVYGFSHADFFTWSVLQQAMASWLGISIGTMTWNATSFHVYQKHYDKAREIVAEYRADRLMAEVYQHFHPTTFTTGYDEFHRECSKIMHLDYTLRNGGYMRFEALNGGPYREWTTVAQFMVWVWYALKNGESDYDISTVMRQFCDTDIGLSAMLYILKRRPDIVRYLDDTKAFQFIHTVGLIL